jgi:hypothetical protein
MRLIAALLTTLLATSAIAASAKGPEAQIEALMKTLEAGKFDGAMTSFFAGSIAAQQKPTEMRAMDGQAKSGLEFYGAPVSYEIVETKKIGNDLVNIKFLTKHKDDVPLFWNALFYRRHEQWEPLGLVFFDDPRKAGFQ